MQPEVLLKIKYRPLRFVYLVDSESDIIKAATLYTHVWGGACSAIFPVPKDDAQTTELQLAIRSFNPDYIFLPENDTQAVNSILKPLLSCCLLYLSIENIESITNLDDGRSRLPVRTLSSSNRLELPHIIEVLKAVYPSPSDSENFYLSTDGSLFETIRSLQSGRPSNLYREHLKHHLSASPLCINSLENLLKVSLLEVIGTFKSPISLTKQKVVRFENPIFENLRQGNTKVFNLFLYESGDISIASRFWNSRSSDHGYSNKLLLPRDQFIKDIEKSISVLSDFLPFVRELIVYVNLSKDRAETLCHSIYDAFKVADCKTLVEIHYQNHCFAACPSRAYSSSTVEMTRQLLSNQSIRFSPTPLTEFDNSRYASGYDAVIEFASGGLLDMPQTYDSSVFLSNEMEAIEYYKKSKSPNVGSRLQPIRADRKGISGIAIGSKECQIYITESEDVISKWLERKEFFLRPTNHTRYAQGFIKRFGGFPETRRLVNSGGTQIFAALTSQRAEKSGCKHSQITCFLREKFSLSRSDAKKNVEENLLKLLAKGLVYRGYSLDCPSCGLNEWYKLDKVDEFIECVGCAEKFQLWKLTSIEFSYKPNELAARFLKSDGAAILSAAAFLSRIVPYRNIHMGGEVLPIGEKNSIAEVDLFVFSKDYLMLVECKRHEKVDPDRVKEIVEHLKKLVLTANHLNARLIVLCIITSSFDKTLMPSIHKIAKEAAEQGVGVHLLLNDELYGFGSNEQKILEHDSYGLNIESLLPRERDEEKDSPVVRGERTEVYSFGGEESLNRELIDSWKQGLKANWK